jgi:hypothetical protein
MHRTSPAFLIFKDLVTPGDVLDKGDNSAGRSTVTIIWGKPDNYVITTKKLTSDRNLSYFSIYPPPKEGPRRRGFMKTKHFATAVLAILALASTSAFANDQITSGVAIPDGQPTPIIQDNGVAQGTIQLWYTVVGSSFPCGTFATFTLNLQDAAGKGTAPSYPVPLNLVPTGAGTPVQLSGSPSTFSVSDAAWSGSSTVTVSIDCTKLGTPSDGQQIVGILNEASAPHLGTISTIQVHIILSIPNSSACLKLYSFVTDQDTGAPLESVSVVEKKSNLTVTSSNPGTISADGLVYNGCPEAQTFDLGIGLDKNWTTIPSNNPGNATFTYTETGEVDPTNFSLAAFGSGTPQGETPCLGSETLASGSSFLATVHSQINSGISVSSLPSEFSFSASLSTAATSCSSGSYLPTTLVSPNPVTSLLPYTVN